MNLEEFRLEITHYMNKILEPLGYRLWLRYDSATDRFEGVRVRKT